MYMWQSRVEIEHYSVVYFDHITVFEVLQCRTVAQLHPGPYVATPRPIRSYTQAHTGMLCILIVLLCLKRCSAELPLTVGKLINTQYHIYTARTSTTLNQSSALQHLLCSNMIKIRNRIMFDFYPGLPHIYNSNYYPQSCKPDPFHSTALIAFSIAYQKRSSMRNEKGLACKTTLVWSQTNFISHGHFKWQVFRNDQFAKTPLMRIYLEKPIVKFAWLHSMYSHSIYKLLQL